MLRFYRVDLLDFYRGRLSSRRLWVLLRQLPIESATSRSVNGGRTPWGEQEHLLADVWSALTKQDHPTRAEAVAKARNAVKRATVIQMRARADKRRRREGVG